MRQKGVNMVIWYRYEFVIFLLSVSMRVPEHQYTKTNSNPQTLLISSDPDMLVPLQKFPGGTFRHVHHCQHNNWEERSLSGSEKN